MQNVRFELRQINVIIACCEDIYGRYCIKKSINDYFHPQFAIMVFNIKSCPFSVVKNGQTRLQFLVFEKFTKGLIHPRRPRGNQSGRGKRRDESFQAQAEKPLGTDSHRTISSFSRVLFVSSYTTAIISPQLPGSFTKLSSPETKELPISQKTFRMLSTGAIQFALRKFCF